MLHSLSLPSSMVRWNTCVCLRQVSKSSQRSYPFPRSNEQGEEMWIYAHYITPARWGLSLEAVQVSSAVTANLMSLC